MSAPIQARASSSETFAAVGRALALAARFEAACLKAAQVAGIARPILDRGLIFADQTSLQALVKKLRKQALGKNLQQVLALPGVGDLGPRLEVGRLARNRLVHELFQRHDPFVTTPRRHLDLDEELANLVLDIAGAEAAIVGFLLGFTDQPKPTSERPDTYPIRMFRWVMKGGEPPSP